MRIDNSPSSTSPPAPIPLSSILVTPVTTTLPSLSGHPWTPGCIAKCPAHPLASPSFTPTSGPFDSMLCVKKNLHLSPLLSHCCNAPESTTSRVALARAGCYSHSSRVTRVGDKTCVLGAVRGLFQTQRPSILKRRLRKTKANKVLGLMEGGGDQNQIPI